jgi:hypothetical protein
MTVTDWVRGDALGLDIPAHAGALEAGGAAFLTAAFRATGALAPDNRVTAITGFREWRGGSTGRKALLSVTYEKPADHLPVDLFVKFSRDFDDELRDRARVQMALEVRFALLSRTPGFPIAVPLCLFADYEAATGTGILITERVAFGEGAIERHYDKCMDYELPAPLEHYQALVTALARLAGTHKSGRLSSTIAREFPFEPDKLTVSIRAPYTAKQLQNRVARLSDFAAKYPRLLPENVKDAAFLAKLSGDVARFPEHAEAIKALLGSNPDFIALCHWNSNIDNAWFWRDGAGALHCGLMDWGHASQMNVAMALWGSLSAAETSLWDDHLDGLLALFVAEYHASGGPLIDVRELKLHVELYVALMGLAWLLDAPPLIQSAVPELAEIENRHDPRIEGNELARAQLHLMTVFLNLWQREDFAKVLDTFLERMAGAAGA